MASVMRPCAADALEEEDREDRQDREDFKSVERWGSHALGMLASVAGARVAHGMKQKGFAGLFFTACCGLAAWSLARIGIRRRDTRIVAACVVFPGCVLLLPAILKRS